MPTSAPTSTTKPTLRLQHLHLPTQRLAALQPVLDSVGNKLGLTLCWDSQDGELLVLERGALTVSDSLLGGLSAKRPSIWIDKGLDDAFLAGIVRQSFADALEALLRDLTFHRPAAVAHAGMVGSDWSPLTSTGPAASSTPDEQSCLKHLHELAHGGLSGRPLAMGYRDHGALVLDPQTGQSFVDVGALAHLRASRRLPQVLDEVPVLREPKRRALDVMLWELGLAASQCAPPQAPANWWQHPLEGLSALNNLQRYTLDPHCLAMARLLRLWPHSPEQLRLHSDAAPALVQGFVQSVLLLRLAFWH